MKPIAVIAPYPELGAMFERMKSLHDMDFDIYNALCDEAIPLTQKLIDEGCKIIISRGETATMIKNQLNLRDSYILEIPITDCDRLSMLTKALEYGNRIAVVGFGATMNTSKFISGIIMPERNWLFQAELYRLSLISLNVLMLFSSPLKAVTTR